MNSWQLFSLCASSWLFLTATEGKVYDRYELAQELYQYGFTNISLMVCIVARVNEDLDSSFIESNYPSDSGGFGYGLFQFYDPYWCSLDPDGGGKCNINCNKFVDEDISDDMKCAHTVLELQGIEAWADSLETCSTEYANVPDWVWSRTRNEETNKPCPPKRDK